MKKIWRLPSTDNAKGVACVATVVLLGGCGGGDNSPPPLSSLSPSEACASLSSKSIATADMGLPTKGGSVVSSTLEKSDPTKIPAAPEYCKVMVKIASVDPAAQPINIQLNLPSKWNGKAVHFGGGGFDGFLVTADGPIPASFSAPSPLAAGYATFGSDGGHSVPTVLSVEEHIPALSNDEVLANYNGDQLKKTHDAALVLLRSRYGAAPNRMYFVGQSGGGREALIASQRFAADYDGIVSYFPAIGGVPMALNFGRVSRALAAPGAFPNLAKQQLLHTAAVKACDGLDGAVDGIVANPAACTFNAASIRCTSGADEGDTCLSSAQIAAMDVFATEQKLPFALASGENTMIRYNVYSGVDLSAPGSGLAMAPPVEKPASMVQPAHSWLFSIFYRGIVTRDAGSSLLSFDVNSLSTYLPRLNYLSTYLNGANPDLSALQKRGGKLLLIHGKDDALIPAGYSSEYYKKVVSTMGASNVDSFMRYFEAPGYGHGLGNFTIDWNSLAALEDWVEKGIAPDMPTIMDVSPATQGRTRPLCQFPLFPKYRGTGDLNSASSFTCSAS